jgi:hypothetical protein
MRRDVLTRKILQYAFVLWAGLFGAGLSPARANSLFNGALPSVRASLNGALPSVRASLNGALPSVRASFSLQLANDNISAAERPAIQAFVNEALAKIPPRYLSAIQHTVTVRFETNLDSTTTLWVPPCDGQPESAEIATQGSTAQVRGQVTKTFWMTDADIQEIKLNALLKTAILAGPTGSQTYACGHHTLYELALATLVHELSHLYDFSKDSSLERDQQIDTCMITSNHIPTAPSANCPDPSVFIRSISHNPTFKTLMNWDGNASRNQLRTRSPDPYEFTDLEESFAVNMEYFLLDPEYGCREPSEYAYFKNYFSFDPYPTRPCTLNTQLTLSQTSPDDPAGALANLDPSRVYQVHFLLASQGQDADSLFGHAMFRIILCAPSRTTVGPECMNDISSHIVVSYAANQGGWTVSTLKGLDGGYPSQMFLYPFYPQIINEYTLDQPRSLTSLPLKFTPDQQNLFIQRVIEQYWAYQGKYYFFTNNCGTEALHLLKSVIDIPGFQDEGAPTPIMLYDQLVSMGLLDASVLKDQASSETSGYYFPSTNQVFPQALQQLQTIDSADMSPYKSLSDYMKNSTPTQREALYQTLKTKYPSQAHGIANRFYILESYIFLQARQSYMSDLSNTIEHASPDVLAEFQKLMVLEREASPLNSGTGYGVPLPADFESASPASSPATLAEIKTLDQNVMQWAQSALQSESDYVNSLSASYEYFLAQVKATETY